MARYEQGRVPRIVCGEDALYELSDAVDAYSNVGAVLVVDEAVALTGYAGRVSGALREIPLVQHIVPAGEPTIATVDAAIEVVRSMPRAAVIGVGGGSALDTAKQAAAAAPDSTSIEPYLLAAVPFKRRRPIIAIPTTSGTGAEVTRTCIVSDTSGRKLWTWGDEMLPDLVLLDPTSTFTMPRHVTTATGLDAFVHALEASSGQRRNSLSAGPAAQALRLVVRHLPGAVAMADDLASRQGMQEAALLAGIAIDNSGTGIAHSIGHALGTLYHVPHGVAVALGIDAAIGWNVGAGDGAYDVAAAALGVEPAGLPGVVGDLFAAAKFAPAVRRLPDHDLDAAAIAGVMAAPENQPMLNNNARVPNDDDRITLARATVEAWARWRAEASPA